jgi:collagen type VII alpha
MVLQVLQVLTELQVLMVLQAQVQANGSSGSGADGAAGADGSSGSSGANGADGSSGSSGADGATGPSGSSGSSGADGSSGSSGADGATGPSGSSGSSGEDGATGATGSSGSSGANGAPGTSGSSGADGAAGANGSSGSSGVTGNAGSSGSSGADGAAGSSGVSGTSGTSAASGGGTPYNNVIRYTFTSGSDLAQLLSSGNIISGLSWSRSGTTISITSTAHGLTSGDYVVVRNMGDTDYVYGAISNVSTNSFDITNAVNSGDTSGTAGVYIPAFKVSTLSDSAITIASPSSGNCQLISMTVYIDDSQTAPKTLTLPSNSLNNGAGQNGSLATRVPPSFRAYGGGSAIGDASYTFSTTTNHNVYSLGGTIDPFGAVLLTFSF